MLEKAQVNLVTKSMQENNKILTEKKVQQMSGVRKYIYLTQLINI